MTEKENRIIDLMRETYIKAHGLEKWKSLSDAEKIKAIMALVRISYRTIENIENGGTKK